MTIGVNLCPVGAKDVTATRTRPRLHDAISRRGMCHSFHGINHTLGNFQFRNVPDFGLDHPPLYQPLSPQKLALCADLNRCIQSTAAVGNIKGNQSRFDTAERSHQ
jgi:hypothetical protein